MVTETDQYLEELIEIWTRADNAGLRRVPQLCCEMIHCASIGDPDLLERVNRLARKAEGRLRSCVEILSRTGTYSTNGSLEQSPQLVTARWEG